LNPKIAKESKSENLLWIEIGLESKWFVAIVYIPRDSGDQNDQTLAELQRDILVFGSKGRAIVMGDFNARVGELPNIVSNPFLNKNELVIKRQSRDKTVSRQGKELMTTLNAVGLGLVNGSYEIADYTSIQHSGNSVIDSIWIEGRILSRGLKTKVWRPS